MFSLGISSLLSVAQSEGKSLLSDAKSTEKSISKDMST